MINSKQWQVLKSAPHRIMFFGGALQTIAVMLWFMIELLTRYGVFWHPLNWAIAPSGAHAYLMIYGMLPFFMFGFLMTTFPRWLKGGEILQQHYVPAFVLLMLGVVCFYAGLLTGYTLLIIAVCSTLCGWGLALYSLYRVLLDTARQDKRHPQVLLAALALGWLCQFAYLIFLISDNVSWLRFAIEGGIWLFLLPVFSTVAHRMIPFFTSSALPLQPIKNPYWAWWTMLIAGAVHCLLEINGTFTWLWLCDAPLAIAAIQLSRGWGFSRSLKIPMLGVLHVGFAWLGIAMLLFSVQSGVFYLSRGYTFILGLAPLHALTIGCFSTLLIGMATRVTLGHSGLPMKVDIPIRLMLVGIQVAAVMRVVADMLPMQNRHWLYFSAGAVWLGCFVPWIVRYLPMFWMQSADGRTG